MRGLPAYSVSFPFFFTSKSGRWMLRAEQVHTDPVLAIFPLCSVSFSSVFSFVSCRTGV